MLRRILLLVTLPLLASFAHAETVTELVAAYRNLRLGSTRPAPMTFTAGHGTYTLASGTASAVLAGERQVGLFLSGAGTFGYETTNKDELTAVRYNARHNDIQGVVIDAEKAVIKDSFQSVLLLGNGLPEIAGEGASSQSEFDKHQALFARSALSISPAAHILAYQKLDNPQAPLVRAEIAGKAFPFIHLYDGSHAQDETLQALIRQSVRVGRFSDTLYPVSLSRQSIGRGNRAAPPARALMTALDIDLTGNMKEEATLTVTETIVPQKTPLKALRFDLWKTLFMDTASRDRHLNLRSVTDDQGRKLPFDHADSDDLIVGLAEPAAPGKAIKLRFEIDGDFLYREAKTQVWELGIGSWFPWLRLHEHAFTFHSVIKVEKPFVAFASGKNIRRQEEGNYNLIETRLDNPVCYIAILAGKYQYSEEVRKGVMVRVASFISKNEGAYKRIRDVADATISYYPFFLGPFPFDDITIIEKDTDGSFAYGQAPAGIVFITSEAFKPLNRDVVHLSGGVNSRFAHEMAHMYFGSAVRRTSREDQWLDEAFAEYAAALFRKAGKNAAEFEKEFVVWKSDAKDVTDDASIPMANRLSHPGDRLSQALTRQGLIYSKGAYLLAALHKDMGDEKFLTFLKSYQKSFRWKQATTTDVIELLGFLTKKDYAPFFEQYYYGTALPDVKLK